MNYNEMIGKAKKLFADAQEILGNEEATPEDLKKVEPMVEDAKKLQARALQTKELENAALEVKEQVADEQKNDSVVGGSDFKSWGEFLHANWTSSFAKNGVDSRLKVFRDIDASGHPVKDLGESVGSTGGFLVPTEFLAQLQSAIQENAIVRSRATVIPMRRRQVNIPVLDQTGTTAGQPHWFGGMQFTWQEEATEKTQSDPTFRRVALVAHKLIGYTRASDELLDDSAISLEAFLSGPLGFAGGAAWMEDYAFLQGTGAGQPLGVIAAGATITVARAAAGAVSYVDLCNMMENFLPTGQGVWVISQSLMSDIIQLSGPSGNASYVWHNNAAAGIPGSMFGMPVIWSEKVPVAGSAGDVGLYDFKYYLIGDRQATTVESTQFDRWRYDQTSWRMVHRIDGQPWLSAPLTLQDGSTQISPFVILGAVST